MAARARQQDNGPADPQATNFCRGIPTILTEGCAHVHVCVFGARTRAIARLDEAGRQQRPAALLRSHARWAKKIDQSFRANVFGARFYGNATYRAGGATRITSAVALVVGAILAVPFFSICVRARQCVGLRLYTKLCLVAGTHAARRLLVLCVAWHSTWAVRTGH